MGRFASQLEQVALTYLTRRWLMFGFVTPFIGAAMVMLATTENSGNLVPSAVRFIALPLFVVIPLTVIQAKIQFAHPRAKLVPDFVSAHLALAALLAFFCLAIYPAIVATCIGVDALDLMAYVLVFSLPAIWAVQFNRGLLMLVSFTLLPGVMAKWTLSWWFLPTPADRLAHLLIVLVGGSGVAAWLWRLSQLREEMDDYEVPIAWQSARPSRAESAAVRSLVARHYSRNRLAAAVVDWWHAQWRVGDRNSFRGRMRLLEYGLSAWPAELSSLVFAGVILAFGVLGGELMPYWTRRMLHAQLAFVLLGALNVVPYAKFFTHRPQMVGELMFPMTRVQLIDGLFATVARQVGVMWIAGYAAAFLVVALYPHEATTLPVVATLLLFSATLAVITFGLGAYFATWSSRLLQIVAFTLCFGPLFGLFGLSVWLGEHVGTVPIAILTLLQLIVGQAFIRFARRKWLNLELG